jgi:asparagine synthetase B (glutamine-hydrolysing)
MFGCSVTSQDLSGSFAFVVFDNKSGVVFAALSTDGGAPLFWGVASDRSAVISEDHDVVKLGCGKSYALFPVGCMFHSEADLKSFEHPMNAQGRQRGSRVRLSTFKASSNL